MKIRDLDSLGPLVASSLRSDATAQGPRLSKSRIFTDSQYNLYLWSLSSRALSHLLVAIYKVLRRIWHLPSYSHTSIVLCTAGISFIHNIILHRFNKFISQCLDSDICLVRYIIIDSLKFAYSFIGYNHLYGNFHQKHLNDSDLHASTTIRCYRHLFGTISPFESYIFNISSF